MIAGLFLQVGKSCTTFSKIWPKRVGTLTKSCGNTRQQYYFFCTVSGIFPLKEKEISPLAGLKTQARFVLSWTLTTQLAVGRAQTRRTASLDLCSWSQGRESCKGPMSALPAFWIKTFPLASWSFLSKGDTITGSNGGSRDLVPKALFSLTSLSFTMGSRWDLAIPLDNWIGLWLSRGSRLQKKTTRSRPDFTGEVTKGQGCV